MAYTPDPAAHEQKRSNGFAVTALVLGIIALVLAFIPIVNIVSFFLAALAIIFGIIGLVASGRRHSGKGMSITGIVLGVVALAVAILMYVLVYNAAEDACEDEGHSDIEKCIDDLKSDLSETPGGY
ncbi:DUF4190 domain-containing protein [Glycomyces arizonensis]|uniref:DUF4190 domain-containing protein n=1 Tax=Glycomyces arizonensis TaxID=256035 RepID=UPI0004116DE5|nr:DUF4190 domain-containing protein [Glycomyces arizonensis]